MSFDFLSFFYVICTYAVLPESFFALTSAPCLIRISIMLKYKMINYIKREKKTDTQ